MNSRDTLTCSLFHLPQDIFRVIFQYLTLDDLMKGGEAFLNNQELLSLYRSSLEGFTITEEITVNEAADNHHEKLISWIIERKLLIEKIKLWGLKNLELDLLNYFRSSLKSIYFLYFYPRSDNSIPVRSQLGHFPSLISVLFEGSPYFTKDKLLSFFSHNPQLEDVKMYRMSQLSHEIIPHLSNYCPKIKILSLNWNDWVNNETMSLLIQQRLFPNLKSLDISYTSVRNQDSLRQFILSRPLLCGLSLPNDIQYSNEFLLFYLRQVIFPSILSGYNNDNDLESHSLAISCLWSCFDVKILDGRNDVVNPEIFTVDILSHLYYGDCPVEIIHNSVQIFSHLSKFSSMIDSILQSQFISFILNDTNPHDDLPFDHFGDLMFHCGVFQDYFPLLVKKYRTEPSSLIEIFHIAIGYHFTSLTTEELQIMIPIVLHRLRNNYSTYDCLFIISKLLQQPSSQLLIDPNTLLLSIKSINISNENSEMLFECLKRFVSVNENYQQLLIESNFLPQIMTVVMNPSNFIDFTKDCLLSSGDGLLVDHLVDSGLFQYLLSKFYPRPTKLQKQIESLFKQLMEFKNNKYSEILMEMELPKELRVKLFEKGERV